MDTISASFLDEEWESLSRLFAVEESKDILHHFNGSNIFSDSLESSPMTFGENVGARADESLLFLSDHSFHTNNFINSSHISQESSNSNEIEGFTFFPNQGTESNEHYTFHESMNFHKMDCNHNDNSMALAIFSDDVTEETLQLKDEIFGDSFTISQPVETAYGDDDCEGMKTLSKRKNEPQDKASGKEDDNSSESRKRKRRSLPPKDGQKNKKATQSRKMKKLVENSKIKQESNAGENVQSSSSDCISSEDNSNASQLQLVKEGGSSATSESETSPNSNGKARANRGCATDPQSLYARRRRERINERLKVLQNLVPNGTKVDISTMLEEAVHYVKFLQLQIKLLSSDDMWMFAPIAYNGMDIGLYQKIAPNLWPLNSPTAAHY